MSRWWGFGNVCNISRIFDLPDVTNWKHSLHARDESGRWYLVEDKPPLLPLSRGRYRTKDGDVQADLLGLLDGRWYGRITRFSKSDCWAASWDADGCNRANDNWSLTERIGDLQE